MLNAKGKENQEQLQREIELGARRLRERLEAEQRTVFTREGGAARTQEGLTGLVEL